ncbi:hypothetical protein BDQ12DRAFT_648908 [Crucibulum laeve]|uniref:Putative gamma-glutamylcyclotransferase n=1 Tax=Crucibulum laeve TaxID=68775 RepID=A0A5C3M6T4_9AGAR|nr:hypothetical protein BDQ12DRAFT_648908 [Crucibulum laeve]
MKRLATFEGPQYELTPVQIHPLSRLIPFTSTDWSSNSPIEHPPPLPSFSALPDPIEGETYVFKDINGLEPTLWSFETFIKEDAWKWHRQEGEIEGKGHAAEKGEEEEGGEGSHSGFFYGTLMHPKILKKVIKNEGEHLQFCSALLLDYTRHEVMHADYPGIVPYSKGKALFDRELSQEERSVRGTLVTGLTHHDMRLLNLFEGREYDLLPASVHPLSALAPVSTHSISALSIPEHPPPLPPLSDLPPAVPCEVYVYKFLDGLNPRLWDFEHFVRNNAWKWHGGEEGKALQEEQSEVARRFERE